MINGAEGETRTRTPIQAQRPQRCLSTNSNTSAIWYGRSGRIRPPGLRFWRPSRYQLSYAPIRSNMND